MWSVGVHYEEGERERCYDPEGQAALYTFLMWLVSEVIRLFPESER
jgi:hypothetical protein